MKGFHTVDHRTADTYTVDHHTADIHTVEHHTVEFRSHSTIGEFRNHSKRFPYCGTSYGRFRGHNYRRRSS